MQGLDLVRLLRHTANQYEQLVLRNQKLDEEIAKLKGQYEMDMKQIKSQVEPLPGPLGAKALEPAKPSTRIGIIERNFPDTMPIAALPGYPTRVYDALRVNNVERVGDFPGLTVEALRETNNCGAVTIEQIKSLARRVGYPFA